MGLQDVNTLFSDEQDLAQVAGTYLSDRSIDLGAAATDSLGNTVISDIGRGPELEVLCQVTEAFVGASGTVQAKLVMADDAALTTNLTVLRSSEIIAIALLVPGYQFRGPSGGLPPGISRRYLGMQYIIATTTQTAGKITAGLVKDRQSNPTV